MAETNAPATLESLKKEKRRLNNHLIAPNLIILVISLIAAASLLLSSLFGLNVHVDRQFVAAVTDFMEENGIGGTETENGSGMTQTQTIAYILKDIDVDISVELQPGDIINVARSGSRESLRALIENSVPDLDALVDTVSEQTAPALMGYAMMQTVSELPEGVVPEDIDTTVFNETIRLIGEQDPVAAKTEFMDTSETFARDQLGLELTESDKETISEYFDKAVELMKDEEGNYSVSNLLTSVLQKLKEEGIVFPGGDPEGEVPSGPSEDTPEEEPSGPSVDIPEETPVAAGMSLLEKQKPAAVSRAAASDQNEAADGEDEIDLLISVLEDPASIVDEMDESTIEIVRYVCLGISALLLLCAGCWAILAFFALLHILLPNKKVGMWYVKMTAFLPFFIFLLVPTLALLLGPQLIPAFPAQLASLSIKFAGMTYVSALCLLALWIISIFWCHPVKKRIKQCKQEISLLKRRGER